MGTTKQELKVNCEKMPGIPVREQSLPCAAKCVLTGQPLDTPHVSMSLGQSPMKFLKKKKKERLHLPKESSFMQEKDSKTAGFRFYSCGLISAPRRAEG